MRCTRYALFIYKGEKSMFTQNTQREIPSTLDDCIRAHPTVETLHFWAKRLSLFGDILSAIMMLAGAVLTIYSTCKLIDLDRNSALMTFFSTGITWVINTIIVFCLFRTAVLILGAIATIAQYTIIHTNVALMEANQNENPSDT